MLFIQMPFSVCVLVFITELCRTHVAAENPTLDQLNLEEQKLKADVTRLQNAYINLLSNYSKINVRKEKSENNLSRHISPARAACLQDVEFCKNINGAHCQEIETKCQNDHQASLEKEKELRKERDQALSNQLLFLSHLRNLDLDLEKAQLALLEVQLKQATKLRDNSKINSALAALDKKKDRIVTSLDVFEMSLRDFCKRSPKCTNPPETVEMCNLYDQYLPRCPATTVAPTTVGTTTTKAARYKLGNNWIIVVVGGFSYWFVQNYIQ